MGRGDQMPFHGSLPRRPNHCPNSAFEGGCPAGYRNFLGTPADGDIAQTSAMKPAISSALLAKLAKTMELTDGRDLQWPNVDSTGKVTWRDHSEDRDNGEIPAGYTYLGQFIAHDLSDISLPSVALDRDGPAPTNLRANPLQLETILGGGPLQSPQLYGRPREGESVPSRLKLGASSDLTLEEFMKKLMSDKPDVRATVPPLEDLPKRDLPRAACPFSGSPGQRLSMPDVTIADSRNDDNVIVGQTTVLFHMFYNRIVDEVRKAVQTPVDQMSLSREILTIDVARTLAVDVYRDIIVNDYLDRILWPDVLKLFQDKVLFEDEADFDKSNLNAVPLEFSHAAYRFGHAMIRPHYVLNKPNSQLARLKELLDTNSFRGADKMPLDPRWLVQWSKFFDLPEAELPNLSQKIAPFFSSQLFTGPEFDVPGEPDKRGLHNLDLQRGAAVSLRSVTSIIERLRGLPSGESIVAGHLFLSDPALRAKTIRTWLEFRNTTLTGADREKFKFDEGELNLLSSDPPLLFFVLFEAAAVADGVSLGPIGSIIVGETLFRALLQRRTGASEENDVLRGSVKDAVFRAKPPTTMRELILFIEEGRDKKVDEVPFI